MVDEILGWITVASSLAGVGVLMAALATWPRGARCRCPGPRGGWLAILDPSPWLRRGRCWYDLTGLPPGAGGVVRCPECGRETAARRRLADGRRTRLDVIGGAALLLALGAFGTAWIRDGDWTRSVPDLPLVAVARLGHASDATAWQDEVDRRVDKGEIDGLPARILAGSLAEELRDDDVRWNASRAASMLSGLWPFSEAALETELDAGNTQSRLLAARVLRRHVLTPSDALLRACVADLRHDGELGYVGLGNARSAAAYLMEWAHLAEPALAEGMASGDMQQRLASAAVAGHTARTRLMDQAVPILVEHLADNDVHGDAKVAAPGLYRFGPAALAHLRPHAARADEQARAIILSIIERLEHPERPLHELEHPLPRITTTCDDPLADVPLAWAISQL